MHTHIKIFIGILASNMYNTRDNPRRQSDMILNVNLTTHIALGSISTICNKKLSPPSETIVLMCKLVIEVLDIFNQTLFTVYTVFQSQNPEPI